MAARIGTLPGLRRTATSPSARLLPFHRHSLTHVLILGGDAAVRRATALTIHAESVLRSGPFVNLDCSTEEVRLAHALAAWMTDSSDSSDPSLMAAERGTLFLDHLHALSTRAQRQLLAFVTGWTGTTNTLDRRWGGRLVCGSGRDLDALAGEGGFLLPLLDCLDKARVSLDDMRQGGAA
jgi:DNA-binding NtrC family response regulator